MDDHDHKEEEEEEEETEAEVLPFFPAVFFLFVLIGFYE